MVVMKIIFVQSSHDRLVRYDKERLVLPYTQTLFNRRMWYYWYRDRQIDHWIKIEIPEIELRL